MSKQRISRNAYKAAHRIYRLLVQYGIGFQNMPSHMQAVLKFEPESHEPSYYGDKLLRPVSWRLRRYKDDKQAEDDGIPF